MPLKTGLLFLSVGLLSACVSGPERLEGPGEASMVLGIPRKANCELRGDGLRVVANENIMGKGLNAAGQLRTSTLVCTDEAGKAFATTDHQSLFVNGNYASVILYDVSEGVNRASGEVKRGTQMYTFHKDIVFSAL